jgi:hypothetical protein
MGSTGSAAGELDFEPGLLQGLGLQDHVPRWIESVESLDKLAATS